MRVRYCFEKPPAPGLKQGPVSGGPSSSRALASATRHRRAASRSRKRRVNAVSPGGPNLSSNLRIRLLILFIVASSMGTLFEVSDLQSTDALVLFLGLNSVTPALQHR